MGSERKRAKLKRRVNVASDSTSSDENSSTRLRSKKFRKRVGSSRTDKDDSREPRKRRKSSKSMIQMHSKVILNSPSWNSSVLHYLNRVIIGSPCDQKINKLKKTAVMNQVHRYRVFKMLSPFERRVTTIAWHPVYSQIAVAGSKGGELSLHNLSKPDAYFCPGIGAGGSIVGLKFSAHDPCIVYTASITGNIRQEDFNGKASKTFLSTFSWENWFSCLDVCYSRKLILTGDCCGCGYLITTTGQEVWPAKKRLHGGKITHIEFSPKDPNIFVTASNDHSVKLWDLRMITDHRLRLLPTHEFPHLRAVNSACFSPSHGCSLLTTDQYCELRVYGSPNWDETLIIKHPHRQFQHLTPIKATWHPVEDIIVVGRYPDENFLSADTRSIDYYDGINGELLHRMTSPTGNIVSLNAFNIAGDSMASAAGLSLMFLKDENVLDGLSFVNGADSEPEIMGCRLRMFREARNPVLKANKKVQTEKKYLRS